MSRQASPRGTFLKIADALKTRIDSNPETVELPSTTEIESAYGVSRGTALRALYALRDQGYAVPVRGGRWRALRSGQATDRRPLADRLVDVFDDDKLTVGDRFPSASALSKRFGASRPTVTRALEKLEAAGWLSEGRQGAVRTVRALPHREGQA